MNRITIFRTSDKKGAKGYTPISNKIIQSEVMTFDESALLIFLLSKPINYTIIQKNILKDCKGRISAGRFRTAWKGLVEKRFIDKFIYYQKNLRREGWKIYENPECREYQNRDARISTPLESKEINNKVIESKEEIVINNTNILGKNVELKNKKKSIPDLYLIESINEATQQLTGATSIGEEILLYSSPDKHHLLLDLIGNIQLESILNQLNKYEFASRQLERNKSSSTEGIETLEPT